MNIQVVNIKELPTGWQKKRNHAYVGRDNIRYCVEASPLANPFVIGKDGNRSEVIEKYRSWLDEAVLRDRSPQKIELLVLTLKALLCNVLHEETYYLVCWCHPQACHASVVLEKMEGVRQELMYKTEECVNE